VYTVIFKLVWLIYSQKIFIVDESFETNTDMEVVEVRGMHFPSFMMKFPEQDKHIYGVEHE
jgi:hypothetical protein